MKKTNKPGENCGGSGTHRTHKRSISVTLDGQGICNVCGAKITTQ